MAGYRIHIRHLFCVALMLLVMFTSITVAADNLLTFNHADLQQSYATKLGIQAIHEMDNEDLFLAAAAIRDQRINTEQRLLNYAWLNQDNEKTYSGGRALGHILKLGVLTYWHNNSKRTTFKIEKHEQEKNSAFVSEFGKYKLRISGSRVKLSFKHRF